MAEQARPHQRNRRRRALVVVVVALAASWSLGGSAWGADGGTDSGAVSARERTTVWLPYWDRAAGMRSLRAHADRIGHLSPFWYQLSANGRKIEAHGAAGDTDVLELARANGIEVVPTIANGWDRARGRRLLATPGRRYLHARDLVQLVVDNGYDGLDVDYENLDPRDRARFTAFLRVLATRMHAADKRLTIAVPAYTNWFAEWRSAYDLKAIGGIVDEVRVMAYDQHWSCGKAGPVGAADWVERVADHAVTRVDPSKLVLGIPLYSYDWPLRRKGCARSHTWTELQRLRRPAQRRGWSATARTPWLAYGRGKARRIVWFENALSTRVKARIADEHGMRGVAFWRLGGEDPRTWDLLAEQLS